MKRIFIVFISLLLVLSGCQKEESNNEIETNETEVVDNNEETNDTTSVISKDDIVINETLESANDSEHVIEVDGEEASYSNIAINKTGDSDLGDEADFYGDNAAIFATNGASLTLDNISVYSNGKHGNGVFSYGEGTTVTITNSVIETDGDCSGGLMTTGGGTMNASNLNIHTTGNSSAAIRSDRGGGTVIVDGGEYQTDGKGSPVIYSTADITVSNATLTSTSSQGVVVEGSNSVTLNNVELIADNNSKNSDNSDYYQAVMIYQSMSGDAAEGLSSFTITDSTLTNENGDIFFVNNTVSDITVENTTIINEDSEGVFLRAEAAGWGNEGSNGGHVNLVLSNEELEGYMVVDEISTLNLYLKANSTYTGAIENEGSVYVEIEDGSKWVLTEDTYISSLTCGAGAIDINGHKLYVDGVEYDGSSAMTGEAIVVEASSSSSNGPGQGGTPPTKPN